MWRHLRIGVADAFGLMCVERIFENPFREQRHRTLPLAHVDILALAGLRTMIECSQHCEGAVHTGIRVRITEAAMHRRPFLVPGQRRQSGERNLGRAVRDIIAIGSGVAVAGERHHDDIRLDPLERVIAKAHPLHHAVREIIDDNVAVTDQPAGDFMRRSISEVQRDRPLALIVLVEVAGTVEAARLALRPWRQHTRDTGPVGGFDPDYIRTEMCQLQGTIGTGPYPGEICNPYPVEWSFDH